jgi:oligogalacturonide lyase
MNIGTLWPSEMKRFTDPNTGVAITQYTDGLCHSNHLYFTNRGDFDDFRKLAIYRDLPQGTNLFVLDLESGEMRQLTEWVYGQHEPNVCCSSLNPTRPEIYIWVERTLVAIDLTGGDARVLAECPAECDPTMTNVTADGKYVCTSIWQRPPGVRIDLFNGYIGFRETFEYAPPSEIWRINTRTGEREVVHAEKAWIGHVNTSPTQSNLLTYCHEGPWELVPQRIFGLNLETGKTWPIRPQASMDESMGHEYWFADGVTIGYHGRTPNGPVYGSIRYDNTQQVEAPFDANSMHFHSENLDLIVGDGRPGGIRSILLWTYQDGAFSKAKRLLDHRGSWHTQRLHVHPRLYLNRGKIVYTADPNGYGNVYIAEVPASLDSLPLA